MCERFWTLPHVTNCSRFSKIAVLPPIKLRSDEPIEHDAAVTEKTVAIQRRWPLRQSRKPQRNREQACIRG
jgi:hypothetical protein